MQSTTLMLNQGPGPRAACRSVPATRGCLVVHREVLHQRPVGVHWVITHAPTGIGINLDRFASADEAIVAARRLWRRHHRTLVRLRAFLRRHYPRQFPNL